jgi:hypothetical protein
MSEVMTLLADAFSRAEAASDTPIFHALAATTSLFSASIGARDTARRSLTHGEPAPLARTCLVPRSPAGVRHRRSLTLTEPALRTGRHHRPNPSCA